MELGNENTAASNKCEPFTEVYERFNDESKGGSIMYVCLYSK